MDTSTHIGEDGPMYVLAGLLVLVLAALGAGIVLYRAWDHSTWKRDQAAAVRRIDSLIDRIELIVETPGSGLTVNDIGEVSQDWVPLKAELEARYRFRAWLKAGRKRHTLDDRFAHALWTLAYKKVKPLNQMLDTRPEGPLRQATIDQIVDVLSTNLDEMSSNVVNFSRKVAQPGDSSQLKISS